MKFHHIGIACQNIRQELESIGRIHEIIVQSAVIFDKEQDAELCLLTLKDGVSIELISGKQVETLLKRGSSD